MPTVRPIPRFGAVGWTDAIYGFSDDVVAFSGDISATILSLLSKARAVGSASLKMTVLPSSTQTVTIGSDVYVFGAGTGIVVPIVGGDLPATAANLVSAINTQGTKALFADIDPGAGAGGWVRIRNAATPGGTVTPGTQDLPLSDTLSGLDSWSQANLNATGAAFTQVTGGKVQFTTENRDGFFIDLPFTPTTVLWVIADDTPGAPSLGTASQALTISGQRVKCGDFTATYPVPGHLWYIALG